MSGNPPDWQGTADDTPSWDHAAAAALDGATVLVGITHDEAAGARLEQFYGTVMAVDPADGITLRLEGERAGEMLTLPPDLAAFERAAPGRYTLRDSEDVIDDPDYTTIWTINPPRS